MNTNEIQTQLKVNWKQVSLFTGLTFVFTWGLDLALQWSGGYGSPKTILFLQLQMFLPAFFAILLGLFIFKDSPFYLHNRMPDGRGDRARGFFYFYMVITMSYLGLAVLSVLLPAQATLFQQLSSVPMLLSVVGLLLFRFIGGKESFARANLRGGRLVDWIIYGGAIVAFIALQAGLNALFHLGKPVDASLLAAQMGIKMQGGLLLVVMAVQMIVVGSLLGLLISFGEEYGWRAFLQGQLVRLGKKRGILLVGLIWGAWHYPVIWMGHNYPGQPVIGTLMMTIYCVLLAFVLGHAMLKTGSIWLAAFMHAIIDQTANYFAIFIYQPASPILSFGVGIYGLPILALVVFLMLRDPVWRDAPVEGMVSQPLTVAGKTI